MDDRYIAGLFDGEGSVGIYRTNNGKTRSVEGATEAPLRTYWAASLAIAGTHRPMIEELVKHMPGASFIGDTRVKSVRTPTKMYSQGHRRPSFKVQITRRCHIESFLLRIRPFLWEKAEQVDIVLRYISGDLDGEAASAMCKAAKRFVFGNPGAVAVRKVTTEREPTANDAITMAQARDIRARVAGGARQCDVAAALSVSAAIVCNVVNGYSYREPLVPAPKQPDRVVIDDATYW